MAKIERYFALYGDDGKGSGIAKCNDNPRLVKGLLDSGFLEIDKVEYQRIQRRLHREDAKAAKEQ
jgi:hypothetical protein